MWYTRFLRKGIAAKRHLLTQKAVLISHLRNSKLGNTLGDEVFQARNRSAARESYFLKQNGEFTKTSDYAVVLHLYYTDNWELLFRDKLKRLAKKLDFDLYITMPASNSGYINTIRQDFSGANILLVPNRGRDVLPFIKTALLLDSMGYRKALKIHSKKSVHRDTSNTASAGSGNEWLMNTVDALIPENDKALDELLKKIDDTDTGLIGPGQYHYPLKMYLRNNLRLIRRIMSVLDSELFSGMVSTKLDDLTFFGGTMFWIDIPTIKDALQISASNFGKEKGQTDGTMAHALERVFCILPQLRGKQVYSASPESLKKTGSATFPDWYFDDVSGGKPRISVVVPVYADWASLSINIHSLCKHYANSEEVIVYYVNDCGPDADVLEARILERIQGFTNFYYYRNEENLGFVKTCNRSAFEITDKNTDLLLLNSDTRVTKDFALIMKRVLYSGGKIGAVTTRSNNATIWSVPMTGRLANHRALSYLLYRLIRKRLQEKYITPTIHGFCVLIRRSVISKYGLFDEIYGRGYGEENDFAMRIQKNGWKCAVANGTFVFHYESRSFGAAERTVQIEKNEKILLERYPNYREGVQKYWDSIREPLK